MFQKLAIAALLLLAAEADTPVCAATAWYEAFEGAEPSWRDAGGDGHYRIVAQQRVAGVARNGNRCEWLQVQGANGTFVHVQHDIGRPGVIDELRPTLWVKSDRPGIQLLARVVLPRSVDPRTGQPLSALLPGASYNNVGRWQQLALDEAPKLLSRQVRSLRTQYGPHVDAREAYLDALVLNVYGGPGLTNVWVDDLDVAGYVGMQPAPAAGPPYVAAAVAPPVAMDAGGEAQRRVQVSGSVLLVDGRPFFPRAVQYRGEPLAALRKLGFNAVWLEQLPSAAQLDEARAAGLWVICPPPRPPRVDAPDEASTAMAPIGPEYAGVLCWNLGHGLGDAEVDVTRRWAQQLRMADRGGRALICHAESNLLAYSRACDSLLLDRRPLGTSLELADYGTWVRQRPRLARPGTPVWTTVQTQLPASLREQLRWLDTTRLPGSSVQPEQLRLLVYHAVAAGSRGLLFLSESPLTLDDADTRLRAASIELMNLEIELLEPWAAAGTLVAHVDASEPQVIGAVLRAERARLLMPMWSAPGAQFVPAQSAANNLTLTVPGLPESISAYQLTPGGVETLRHRRVTGGTRVTLDEFGLTDLILLAQDPLIINALMQRSTAIGRRAAELHRTLAVSKLQTVQEMTMPLAARGAMASQTQEWVGSAHRNLQRCDQWLTSRKYTSAYVEAARAMRALRLTERAAWENSVAGLPSPVASPGAVTFATLAAHWQLTDRISAGRLGTNLLPGGDFERLDLMVQSGWRNWHRPPAGVSARVDLSPQAGRGGGMGAVLTAVAEQPESAPAALEVPPIIITSAPVAVEAGQLVCIHGWVNIPEQLTAGVDGLVVSDSLGGEPLAARFTKTTGWQRFLLYRVAPQSGTVNVQFALGGLGEVRLDDVVIEMLQSPSAAPVNAQGWTAAP